MANSSKSAVFYSDMHVGSVFAPCTADPEITNADTDWRPNRLQKELKQIWSETTDDFLQKPRVKVINGEPINGGNRKSLGKDNWTTDINDQVTDSVKLIKEIPAEHTLLIRGSPYHVDIDGTNFEERVARELNADRYRAWGKIEIPKFKGEQREDRGGFTDYFAKFEMYGKHFHCTHHIGFNRWFAYRTTALAREMAAMHFDKSKAVVGPIDIYVRSHVHYFVNVNFVHTKGFINPAWKFADAFAYRGGAGGITPDVGCVEVIVEPNGHTLIEPHVTELKIKPRELHY